MREENSRRRMTIKATPTAAPIIELTISEKKTPWQPMSVKLFGSSCSLPLGGLMIASLVVGFFAGISDYLSLGRGAKKDEKKAE